MSTDKFIFIVYDSRGEEDGCVLTTAHSLKEARKDIRTMFADDSRIFKYKILAGNKLELIGEVP